MARVLQSRYKRIDKRSAARQEDRIDEELNDLMGVFIEDFENNPEDIDYLFYHNEWMIWAEWYNNQKDTITLADPRVVHNLLVAQDVWEGSTEFPMQQPFFI